MNTDLLRKTLNELKDSVATIKARKSARVADCDLTQQTSNFSNGNCPATIASQRPWRHMFRHPAVGLRLALRVLPFPGRPRLSTEMHGSFLVQAKGSSTDGDDGISKEDLRRELRSFAATLKE